MPAPDLPRRAFLSALAAALPAAGQGSAASGPHIAMIAGDLSEETLRFTRQLGLDWIDLATRPLTVSPPPGQPPRGEFRPWIEAELRQDLAKAAAYGLRAGVKPLGAFPQTLLAGPHRDRELEAVCESIRIAGRCGIPVVEYNFILFRASEGYYTAPGRGRSQLRAFDFEPIRKRPAVPELGSPTAEELWSRYAYFLKAVLPVAEKAGVKLAVHPNDPPVASFRGLPNILRTPADFDHLFRHFPSPANGMTLDTGVLRETASDPVAAITRYGRAGRIHHVHMRNVRLEKPFEKYTEVFHDEGDADLAACMRALVRSGYQGCIVPDHTPHLSEHDGPQREGWALAVGYLKGLLASARC
jgi:mannonate dehydratase